MIDQLRDTIIFYTEKNCNTSLWEDVRKRYSYYSYLSFLCIAAYEMNKNCTPANVVDTAKSHHLEDDGILELITDIEDADAFMHEIFGLLPEFPAINVESLYQDYLSQDFTVKNGCIRFDGGKNNRDILGAYYTEEAFAREVAKKAISDYLRQNKMNGTPVKIADFSCGGGAFLVCAAEICAEKEIPFILYGYDVDPVAALITRLRLMKTGKNEFPNSKIILGNPLLSEPECGDEKKRFHAASTGRYYHPDLGITIREHMDIIIGNPPWEKIRFEEKKFLRHFAPSDVISTKTDREAHLKNASDENRAYYRALSADYEAAKKQIKRNPLFSFSNSGELNTYALFTELSLKLLNHAGVAGLIVKASLVKIPAYSKFFQWITKEHKLYELYMFHNRSRIFHIDSREEFSVIFLTEHSTESFKVALNLDDYKNFADSKKMTISYEQLKLVNPDTAMMPNLESASELSFLTELYVRHKTFQDVFSSAKFGRLVHLTNHSDSIVRNHDASHKEIYEGKFIELYTGRYGTFKGVPDKMRYKNKAAARIIDSANSTEFPEARFFIDKEVWNQLSRKFTEDYIIAWRSLTSATNRRTMLATLLPKVPTCQSIQLLQLPDKQEMVRILSIFNSIIFDYFVRMKMAGLDLTQTIVKQIPVPNHDLFKQQMVFRGVRATADIHINSRVYALYQCDNRLDDFFKDLEKYPIEKARKKIIAELDCLIALLYDIKPEELRFIAGKFSKFYTKTEVDSWFQFL